MMNRHSYIALLKTKSTPTDGYENICRSSQLNNGVNIVPQFVPVLLHKFNDKGMSVLGDLITNQMIGNEVKSKYGGMIFTSQRAVEAFAAALSEMQDLKEVSAFQNIPFYSVGPATTKALAAIPQIPNIQIFGEHTGNGKDLAAFMLQHYNAWFETKPELKRPLLFLVGEQRRDIIPKTLMDPSLDSLLRIEVTEQVVYETTEMPTFAEDFAKERDLDAYKKAISRWIVVFSPTGCDTVLRGLGMLDAASGKVIPGKREPGTYIATIGPTTRQHLLDSFDFEPDICAKTPSPEGIIEGIIEFESISFIARNTETKKDN
ncbi:hypothetical protein VHEMI09003 [[Torrubiella] hemipterigena]|uniref:Tetrapyrrole biosynthesis uroporphyrinogen III synthase domain-containing protein n=1 Tax=[Torrubiella] hemipterigena TaxID=1531966 RepID=A0A0A1TPI1_9HYPO|nr:hypothetical protein VHEMI09003 [[Torrubiella] hemipterigena]